MPTIFLFPIYAKHVLSLQSAINACRDLTRGNYRNELWSDLALSRSVAPESQSCPSLCVWYLVLPAASPVIPHISLDPVQSLFVVDPLFTLSH